MGRGLETTKQGQNTQFNHHLGRLRTAAPNVHNDISTYNDAFKPTVKTDVLSQSDIFGLQSKVLNYDLMPSVFVSRLV